MRFLKRQLTIVTPVYIESENAMTNTTSQRGYDFASTIRLCAWQERRLPLNPKTP
jgi:hypothetical protein